jgi:hypothetical protein
MFTIDRASQIFPNTLSADVVPAITARFKLLNAEDQLALIWYAYLEMGRTITVAAPAAARMQFAEGVHNPATSHQQRSPGPTCRPDLPALRGGVRFGG